jgi:flagellar hook-basal body protein
MSSDRTTIQSLRAVDAWIDVINANINGGVRTAFKSSRLKFAGSNTNLARAGTSSNLPLQFAEPSLTTANTVVDWTQGAVTASTERTHLAIQGDGLFVLNIKAGTGNDYFTRDGEFSVDNEGYLRHSSGLYLFDPNSNELVYDDTVVTAQIFPLGPPYTYETSLTAFLAGGGTNLVVVQDKDQLQFTNWGSTVLNYQPWNPTPTTQLGTTSTSILSKSLEASNASMTQSVPELSLAQKLFSALTKVLQTSQTNLDSVLNLVR